MLKEGENYSIVATKSSNRNVMQFNAGNNPPVFSCYSSASMVAIDLYPWSMVKVNTDPVITFGETEKTVAADATSVLFTYTKNAYVTEEPTVSVVSGADCLGGDIVVLDGTITVPLKANTEAVEKTIALSASGQGIAQAVSLTITQQAFVPVTATTVAEILAAGEGTYDLVENLLVYSVAGSNAIVGDATGKMLLYKSGMTVGDLISISGAAVTDFNGILEIHGTNTTNGGGSFTTVSQGNAIDHGTPADLDDDSVASSVAATFQGTGYHSAAYVKMTGAKSGGKIGKNLLDLAEICLGVLPDNVLLKQRYIKVFFLGHKCKSLTVTHIVPSFARQRKQFLNGLLVVPRQRTDTQVDDFQTLVESNESGRESDDTCHPKYQLLKTHKVAHLVGQLQYRIAAQVDTTQARKLSHLGRHCAYAIAAKVQFLKPGEGAYLGRYRVDEVASQVELAQIVHLKDLGRYLSEALKVKLQNIDRIGVANLFERLVDAPTLGCGCKGQGKKECKQKLLFHNYLFIRL